MAELLRPRRPGRGPDRRVPDRGRRRATGHGVAADPLAGQLGLVRARRSPSASGQVRGIGLNTALGAPVPHIAEFSVWYSLPMAIAINIVNPLNAQLPEEASFRGWAQPKLQTTRTPLAATVLMAIGVTIWHIPFFLMPQFGSSPIEATSHRRRHLLVRLVVQPRLGQRAAHPDRARHRWHHRDQHPVAGRCRHDPDDLARTAWSGAWSPSACWSSTAGSGPSRQHRSTTSIALIPGMGRGCDMHPEDQPERPGQLAIGLISQSSDVAPEAAW